MPVPYLDRKRAALWGVIAFVTLLSFVFRAYYVLHAQVLQPVNQPNVRADAAEYYHYAWNMVNHSVFSKAVQSDAEPIPDSFRDPGYPAMMALGMKLFPDWDTWYAFMLYAQALMGGATVLLLVLAIRRELPMGWLLIAGALAAVWPHSVTMPSFLLSETLTGFTCALAIFFLSNAIAKPRLAVIALAGVAFSVAALTNAVVLPAAPLIAVILFWKKVFSRQQALILLVSALVLPMLWGARGMSLPPGESSKNRAVLNFVQGSWPIYDAGYQLAMRGDPLGMKVLSEADAEYRALIASPQQGWSMIAARMGQRPLYYLAWYASKPTVLWGWDIRIGQGDVYVYPTRHSPFMENQLFMTIERVTRSINLLVLLLATVACGRALLAREHETPLPMAVLLLLITAVYSLLQSEPRYCVAFRGEEIMLATLGLRSIWIALGRARVTISNRNSRLQP